MKISKNYFNILGSAINHLSNNAVELKISAEEIDQRKFIQQLANQYRVDIHSLFKYLWEGNEESKIIATYLLPEILKNISNENKEIIQLIFETIDSQNLSDFTAKNLALATNHDYLSWLSLYKSLKVSENKIGMCLLVQTLGYLSDYKVIGIPYYLLIIKKMFNFGEIIPHNCISWALIYMYNKWPESVQAFIESLKTTKDPNIIQIVCNLAISVGRWIIPVLENWLSIKDDNVKNLVTSTLILVSNLDM